MASRSRLIFESGMVRDVADDKINYLLLRDGPMYQRWAEHVTRGARYYSPRNWMLADSINELKRFEESASRHFEQWLQGMVNEDHAAAAFFNINGAEYVKEFLAR